MEKENVYTGKTVEEATAIGLEALGITEEEAEITVLEEGKKKLIGGSKARVKIAKKLSGGQKATEFIDGLTEILGVNCVSEVVSDGEKLEINLTSTESSRIIGRHGEVLDAIQALAGAVANIGNENYKKVVVDCENYRSGREKTLVDLAHRLAKKAVEKQRRITLEPMNPYERRIIHSALSDSTEVKTISSGKEPTRFVIIVPNNERPYDRRDDRGFKRGFKGGERHGDRGRGDRPRASRPSGGSSARGKKEIHFGTFLGNSNDSGE